MAQCEPLTWLNSRAHTAHKNLTKHTHVDSYEWLALSLTLTYIEFTIESPDDFRAYLAHHANRMLRGALPPR